MEKQLNKLGIVSYGVALPYARLKVEEVIELWKNSSLDLIQNKQGVKERSVLDSDEDGNTLAIASAREMYRKGGIANIDALYYGTCTNAYDSRPSGTIIQEALNLNYDCKCYDLQFSTKSGTSALFNAYALLKANLADNALAIGSDTINRHTAPGDLVEPYCGAGAAAFLLGKERVIATIDAYEAYSSDLSDGFRLEGERYLRSGMLLGTAKNEVGLDAYTKAAAGKLFNKTGLKASDFNYAVFQQVTPSYAAHSAKLLGFNKVQYEASIFADMIGDTGSASSLIGLAKVLDIAKANEKIFLASYGFGAGADVFVLTVTDEIKNIQRKGKSVEEIINRKRMVDYKEAMKMEYKYLRHDYPLNAYL